MFLAPTNGAPEGATSRPATRRLLRRHGDAHRALMTVSVPRSAKEIGSDFGPAWPSVETGAHQPGTRRNRLSSFAPPAPRHQSSSRPRPVWPSERRIRCSDAPLPATPSASRNDRRRVGGPERTWGCRALAHATDDDAIVRRVDQGARFFADLGPASEPCSRATPSLDRHSRLLIAGARTPSSSASSDRRISPRLHRRLPDRSCPRPTEALTCAPRARDRR